MSFIKIPLIYSLYLLICFGFLAKAEEVSLESDTGVLYGTLEKPESPINNVAAMIIAGSGPTDRNGNNPLIPGKNDSLKMLAEGLASLGYASLRTDKRGIAKSKSASLEQADVRFETFVTDAVSWIEYLRDEQGFKKIIVIGHSEGSLVSMLAAQDEAVKDSIVSFISVAGAGESAQDIMRSQLAEQLSPTMLDGDEEVLVSLENGQLVTELPESIASTPFLATLFQESIQPYLISWFAYDPSKVIAELDLPVFIIQGNHDIQITENNAERLHAASQQSELSIIEGMNHVLKEAPKARKLNIASYSNPDLALADGFIDAIENFLTNNLKNE